MKKTHFRSYSRVPYFSSLQLGRFDLRCRQVFYHFRGRSHNDDEERVVDQALGVGKNSPHGFHHFHHQIRFGKCSCTLPSCGNRQVPRAPSEKLRGFCQGSMMVLTADFLVCSTSSGSLSHSEANAAERPAQSEASAAERPAHNSRIPPTLVSRNFSRPGPPKAKVVMRIRKTQTAPAV